jgi:hypothetical protein
MQPNGRMAVGRVQVSARLPVSADISLGSSQIAPEIAPQDGVPHPGDGP